MRVLHKPPVARAVDDVAVADHRDVQQLDQVGDAIPVRLAGELLRARAPMHRHPGAAALLQEQADLVVVDLVLVPAGADLRGDGHRAVRDHGRDDAVQQRHVGQQSAAAALLHDLLDRAAEVDVQHVEAAGRQQVRGLRHVTGIGAEDLHADQPLFALGVDQLPGVLAAVGQAAGRGELAEAHVGAEAAADVAEGTVGDPRHGRQQAAHTAQPGQARVEPGRFAGQRVVHGASRERERDGFRGLEPATAGMSADTGQTNPPRAGRQRRRQSRQRHWPCRRHRL